MYSHILKKELFSSEEIEERVKEMALEISRDYKNVEVVVLGILKGAFLFMADLSRHLNIKCEFDFMEVSSYRGGTKSSGQVRILKDLDTSIEDKHVLIVEDIVDNGLTLNYILNYLKVRKPKSVRICSLLDKKGGRKKSLAVDYAGFDCPNEFVVGYGLDYQEFYRNIPFVGVLKDEFIES